MNKIFFIALSAAASIMAVGCSAQKQVPANHNSAAFDYEAHRGGRGLMPENTIAAMRNAIDLGVTTLELDLQISKDKQVVVSHDPYFNPLITTTPSGTFLTAAEAKNTLLYSMPYDSIRKYDVGLKPYPAFPRQKKLAAVKPRLADLVDASEAYAAQKGRLMQYNMEIKSIPGKDNINHPVPAEFVSLVMKVLEEKKVTGRTIIQSFDIRPLQILHKEYPEMKLSFLVDKKTGELDNNLKSLGFDPAIYSPEYSIVTKEMVDECHKRNIKVIPWTVNDEESIRSLKAMGVDGVISDYPDLFKQAK